MVQWLRPCLPVQRAWDQSLAGKLKSHTYLGPKNQNIKQKQHCNKFNKDFKNGPHLKKNLRVSEEWTQNSNGERESGLWVKYQVKANKRRLGSGESMGLE